MDDMNDSSSLTKGPRCNEKSMLWLTYKNSSYDHRALDDMNSSRLWLE